MAKLTLYFCDLCGESSKKELEYKISLTWVKEKKCRERKDAGNYSVQKHTKTKSKIGDICEECYKSLSKRLEQETEPVLPKVVRSTLGEKAKSPKPGEQIVEKSDAIQYDGPPTDDLLDFELNHQPSAFTLEKKRKYLKQLAKQGCRHNNGYSMDNNEELICIDCRKKVRV